MHLNMACFIPRHVKQVSWVSVTVILRLQEVQHLKARRDLLFPASLVAVAERLRFFDLLCFLDLETNGEHFLQCKTKRK